MFTGIVKGRASIVQIVEKEDARQLVVRFPEQALSGIERGASIALNGACLTVVAFDKSEAHFDVIDETLRLTNLGALVEGSEVNFERAAKIGDEIGGHLMSGHIMSTSVLLDRLDKTDNVEMVLSKPAAYAHYILSKGYIGLNGCSLTIGRVTNDAFSIHLIPETLEVTTFGVLKIGDTINLEIDSQTQAVVDTVERVLDKKG